MKDRIAGTKPDCGTPAGFFRIAGDSPFPDGARKVVGTALPGQEADIAPEMGARRMAGEARFPDGARNPAGTALLGQEADIAPGADARRMAGEARLPDGARKEAGTALPGQEAGIAPGVGACRMAGKAWLPDGARKTAGTALPGQGEGAAPGAGKTDELPPGGEQPLSGRPTTEQLERINRLTRRAFSPEEVFVFPVVLCDNDIDRDMERFDDGALEALAELFVGKTGVFDHAAKAENQSARIFHTEVATAGEEAPRLPRNNAIGEPYRCVRAWAYMARCEKNRDLILEIDAGIKKEVSVGCAVAKIQCSICGQDWKQAPCEHQKGRPYDGEMCHHLLREPVDAYEWSFVAVPAQRRAGVSKTRGGLEKLYFDGGEAAGRRRETGEELERLKTLAKLGEEHLRGLRRQVVKAGRLHHPGLEPEILEQVAEKMEPGQLDAFLKAFSRGMENRIPTPQLAAVAMDAGANEAYRV